LKSKIILLLALLFGLTAAGGTYFFLANIRETYRQSGDFTKVVVARQRIPARTQITAQMIDLKELPAKYINEQAVVDPGETVGKITRAEILPGEQILRDRLVKDKDSMDGLSFLVTPGKRAVTISVNDVSGLAGFLKAGDRVDVLATFDLQGAPGQDKSSITSMVVQNVDVLSVDQNTSSTPSSPDGKKTPSTRTLTLLVTPEQAQPLVLCSEKGSIRLLLRSATDQEIVALPSVRMSQLVH